MNYNDRNNNKESDINSINNQDIDLFIKTYENELNIGNIPHCKIGLWIEFLKAKKFYNINNIDEDAFFNKRHSITKSDIKDILIHLNKIKKGKHLYKSDNYAIHGNNYTVNGNNFNNNNTFINYNIVDDNEDYSDNEENQNKNKNFELLSQVEGALYEYNEKMRKNKNKNKTNVQNNAMNNYRNDFNDKRVNNDMNNCNDHGTNYNVQDFAKSPLTNSNKTHAINQLSNQRGEYGNYGSTSDINKNNFDTDKNNFDMEFKRSIPNIVNNKRHQEHNLNYNSVNNENNMNCNMNGGGGVGGGSGINYNERYNQDVLYSNNYRFNQDHDILKANLLTRDPSQKNKQPFENQFQYLDCNYNRIPNKTLIGESSRMDNRSYIH